MKEEDKPIAKDFAARLKTLRLKAGMTMSELGSSMPVTMLAPAIARYEAGGALPSWATVVRLAEALGVTPDAFLEEKKPRKGK